MPDIPRSPKSPQVSLRMFLVFVLAAGLSLGLLGRLFLVNPESFLSLITIISALGPFVLAIATIVVVSCHRWPAWSVPLCSACRHDLRWTEPDKFKGCPHCEADLAAPGAISFASGLAGSWRLFGWAIVLGVAPVIGLGTVALIRSFAGPSPGALGLQTNQQIIQQRLLPRVNEPWVWKELERRLTAGKLSQQEVDDAVNVLIGHMKAAAPGGWNQPLNWQDAFLRSASMAGMISDPVVVDLCDAFYNTKVRLAQLPRVREGGDSFRVQVTCGSPWNRQPCAGVLFVWEMTAIRLGDEPLGFRQTDKNDHQWSGYHDGSLPAGEHELTVEIQCAYIDGNELAGLNPSQLPAKSWPKARKRWKQTLPARLKVYTKDEPILNLVSDTARAPDQTGAIRIQNLALQTDRNGRTRIFLLLDFTDDLAVAVSFDIAVKIGEQTIPLGHTVAVHEIDFSMTGARQFETWIDPIDPTIRTADVILTPNPQYVERESRVEEIWGETLTLRGIPLERFDLKTPDGERGN